MPIAKRIMDWIFNIVLVIIAVTNGAVAIFADTFAKRWTCGTVSFAFAVTAFFFIRYTVLTAREESK